MTDKHTLDLAREWAEWVREIPSDYSEIAVAAAEVISDLPDEWVSADTLRKYITDWRKGLNTAPRGNYEGEMLDDLEALLPTPPAPEPAAHSPEDAPVGDLTATDDDYLAIGTEHRYAVARDNRNTIIISDNDARVTIRIPSEHINDMIIALIAAQKDNTDD